MIKTNNKGFTLVEVSIVLSLIAIMALITSPNIFNITEETKEVVSDLNERTVKQASMIGSSLDNEVIKEGYEADISDIGSLSDITINYTGSNDLYILMSPDGNKWYTYRDELTTTSFGKVFAGNKKLIPVDITSKGEVKSKGLSKQSFNDLTATDWSSIVVDKKIKFGYYLEGTDGDLTFISDPNISIFLEGLEGSFEMFFPKNNYKQPSITSIDTIKTTIEPNENLNLTPIIDYEGDKQLVYSWTSENGNITNKNDRTAIFSADQNGTYTANLVLTDGMTSVKKSKDITVFDSEITTSKEIVISQTGSYQIIAYGAAGYGRKGYGGKAGGEIALDKGDVLQITAYNQGQGGGSGGSGGVYKWDPDSGRRGSSGGGGTIVKLNDNMILAAGGGGGGGGDGTGGGGFCYTATSGTGGRGGDGGLDGLNGQRGTNGEGNSTSSGGHGGYTAAAGGGGSSSSGDNGDSGEDGPTVYDGGGGGGSASSDNCYPSGGGGGGAGGKNYIDASLTNITESVGSNSGNGYVELNMIN
jgi:prepilin-type N-terminal cleavage/methylation domain-containing protein